MPSSRSIRKSSQRTIADARAIGEELRKNTLRFVDLPETPRLVDLGAGDLSPVPLALLSRGGVIVSAAASLFRLFDATPGDVLSKPLPNFIAPSDHPGFFRLLTRSLQSGETERGEFSMGLPGSGRKDVLLVIAPAIPFHPVATFRVAFVDLGNIEPREFGPRPPQENTRIIEAIDGIVWEADYPQRFTFVSPQAQRILGFSPKSWLTDPDFWEKHIWHEDRDRVVQARADAVHKPADHVLEYRMVRADRQTIWVKDSAVILAGAPGWTRMCGIITDISDLQYARENLKRANDTLEAAVEERTAKMEQSLEAMETLCYGIAHDLKAPVRGLEGFVGILLVDYHDVFDKEARNYAHRCRLALARMNELIDAILAYGRLNHTVPELIPLDPRTTIDRVLASLEPEITESNAKIDVQLTVPHVCANPYLLEQIFTNLIANALKFVKPGTHPEISISAAEVSSDLRPPISDLRPPTSSVRITVTDNGIGMPSHATARMFGMFQKFHRPEEYPGTGIGLAVVKRAVELMNGRVGVFSEPNHGSSFWIELPSAS